MCTVFVLIFPLSRTVHGAIHELKHGFGRVLKIRSRLNVSARTCRYVSYTTVPGLYSSQKYHINDDAGFSDSENTDRHGKE